MGVEVVNDEPNSISLRIDFVNQPFHPVGEVLKLSVVSHLYMAPAPQRLEGHKQIACPLAFVFIVMPLGMTWLTRD